MSTEANTGKYEVSKIPCPLQYTLEVHINNLIAIVIQTTKEQMLHVVKATMQGVHDCFLADDNDDNDPILLNKMKERATYLPGRVCWDLVLKVQIKRNDSKEDKQHKLLTLLLS